MLQKITQVRDHEYRRREFQREFKYGLQFIFSSIQETEDMKTVIRTMRTRADQKSTYVGSLSQSETKRKLRKPSRHVPGARGEFAHPARWRGRCMGSPNERRAVPSYPAIRPTEPSRRSVPPIRPADPSRRSVLPIRLRARPPAPRPILPCESSARSGRGERTRRFRSVGDINSKTIVNVETHAIEVCADSKRK